MLDDQDLSKGLSDDDKKYLEEFENIQVLGLTNTKINSLEKLPELESLRRVGRYTSIMSIYRLN
jgi:hypothetical protein